MYTTGVITRSLIMILAPAMYSTTYPIAEFLWKLTMRRSIRDVNRLIYSMKIKPAERRPETLLDNTAYLIIDIGRILKIEFDKRMRRLGITRSEWWLLTHIWFFEGKSQQELADILDMTKGGLAKLLARLERKGILERRGDTRAGRAAKLVYLTTQGKPLASKVDKASVQLVHESDSAMGAARVETLHELLRDLRTGLLRQDRS